MKKFLFFILSVWCMSPVFSQVNKNHNHLRARNQIIKQQVEYKELGANRFWEILVCQRKK